MLTLSRLPNVRATLLTASAMAAFCFAEPAAAQAADAAPSQATPTAPAQPTTDKDKTTAAPAPANPDTTAANASTGSTGDADIVVTASRLDLLGTATTASQGHVTQQEIMLRPITRPGELFESIPGLVVTIHSGEGKANQYLIRGFNLDHGTDFANFVDDMPVNRPTNTHGQGYSDLAFLMPQIISGIDYTKGPYYAAIGDFGSVASSHAHVANEIANQVSATVGTDGYQDLFMGGTAHFDGDKRLLGALELGHFDGAWKPKQDFQKINAALRYSQGDATQGWSLTGMFYQSSGGLITDQPQRAIDAGLISRFGTLDPSDHSKSLRYSLSGHLDQQVGSNGKLAVSLYGIHATMTLWNNFTHYLDDPVNGDQEAQNEKRDTLGGDASYTVHSDLGAISADTVIGVQGRYDSVFVNRQHTKNRTTLLGYCTLEQADGSVTTYPAVNTFCNADHADLLDLAGYLQNTMNWTDWLRTIVGVREEYYHATDRSEVTGTGGRGSQWLFQPKANLVLGPFAKTELYLSWGRGFHSDDVRGVFGTLPEQGIPLAGGATPLLAATTAEEIGLRTDIIPKVHIQIAAFQQDFNSELVYNADTGQDEAGAPSRRKGLEFSAQYHPLRWLELNTDLSFAKPRYRTNDLAAYGLNGPYIADAPYFTYSAGILVNNLGRWSGSLQWRRLGTHPLSDGDRLPEDNGYSEFNLDVSYALPHGWKIGATVLNIFNSKDDAADYYYTTRLPGEPAEGVTDFQVHPLDPRAARFTLTKIF
jgi:outer membrane receptor protein involved in Fe transport